MDKRNILTLAAILIIILSVVFFIDFPNVLPEFEEQIAGEAPEIIKDTGEGVRSELVNAETTEVASASGPRELEGLYIRNHLKGADALELIERTIGPDFPLNEAEVVSYGGNGYEVVVWHASIVNEGKNRELVETINKRLVESEKFSNYMSLEVDGEQVYGIETVDTKNYYFNKGKCFYWITIIGEGDAFSIFKGIYRQL
ncbi:MAG: hypothetical protein ACOYBM_02575 [Dethiobacteria bacterium]